MFKRLTISKAWLAGAVVGFSVAGLPFALQAQDAAEPTVAPHDPNAVEAADEPVSVAPPGARFLIPGRTLLIEPLDGTPPVVVNGTELDWRTYNTKLVTVAQTEFYHAAIPENQLAEMRVRVAGDIALEHLLLKEAENRGIEVDEEQVQQSVDAVESRYRGNESWEERRDETLPRIREEYTNRSLLKSLEEQVRKVEEPTPEQVRAFYDENPETFTEPVSERVSVILLGVDPSAPTSAWEKARVEAEGILKKIKEGGDFISIARLRSTDSSSEEGGSLGYLHRGMLSDEGQDVVDKMEEGDVSDPVRILQGYVIFKLNERIPARLVSFEKARERALALYIRTTSDEQWEDFKKNLKDEAEIVINPILVAPQNPDDSSESSS